MKIAILVILTMVLTACNSTSNETDVQAFFNGHRIGYSADFGLFHDKHELVAAIFGFGDDLKVCLKIAETMNKEEPDAFSCQPLNH